MKDALIFWEKKLGDLVCISNAFTAGMRTPLLSMKTFKNVCCSKWHNQPKCMYPPAFPDTLPSLLAFWCSSISYIALYYACQSKEGSGATVSWFLSLTVLVQSLGENLPSPKLCLPYLCDIPAAHLLVTGFPLKGLGHGVLFSWQSH